MRPSSHGTEIRSLRSSQNPLLPAGTCEGWDIGLGSDKRMGFALSFPVPVIIRVMMVFTALQKKRLAPANPLLLGVAPTCLVHSNLFTQCHSFSHLEAPSPPLLILLPFQAPPEPHLVTEVGLYYSRTALPHRNFCKVKIILHFPVWWPLTTCGSRASTIASVTDKLSFKLYSLLLILYLNSQTVAIQIATILGNTALVYNDSLYCLDFISPRTEYKFDWFSKYFICVSLVFGAGSLA